MGINHQTFNLVSTDGTALRGRYWKPGTEPVATMCIVHGIGEHSARYDAWARRFSKQGIMVYAFDLRGHGESEGSRGNISKLSEFMDDIGSMVRRCKRNYGEIPGFIYGHSMGGNLVLSYLMGRRQDFAGAIITSPWITMVNPPGAFKQKIGRWLNKLYPDKTLSTRIRSHQLTSLPKKMEESDNDVLMHSRISIRLFHELSQSAEEIVAYRTPIRIPVMLLHGESDPITRYEASRDFASNNQVLFTYKGYESALHELHNEPVADLVFNDILAFIKSNVKR
jgi:acylglycerol lipase